MISRRPARGRATVDTVGVWLGALGRLDAASERAGVQELDSLRFGTLWIGEGHTNKEAFSHAGLLLAATTGVTVATGIANIWVRDSTAMTAAANTLAEAYPNRFILGLGVSHAEQVNHRGHQYGRPLTAMREYLDAMDASRYLGPPPLSPVPRVLAALGPKMLELAGERTSGALTYLVPPSHTLHARGILGDDAMLAVEQAVLIEPDVATARRMARQHLRFYLTLPNYVNNLLLTGFTDEDVAGGGSDRLADALVAHGDAETIAARVQAHLDAGADHVAIQPIGAGHELRQLRELAPALIG